MTNQKLSSIDLTNEIVQIFSKNLKNKLTKVSETIVPKSNIISIVGGEWEEIQTRVRKEKKKN